jgi:hypothetical protein
MAFRYSTRYLRKNTYAVAHLNSALKKIPDIAKVPAPVANTSFSVKKCWQIRSVKIVSADQAQKSGSGSPTQLTSTTNLFI